MKQKDFLVWMLMFPVTNSFSELVTEYFIGRTFSDSTHAIACFIALIIYFGVGYLLWNKRPYNQSLEPTSESLRNKD